MHMRWLVVLLMLVAPVAHADSGGTLRIQIKNPGVERGAILIDGEERGSLTPGGSVVISLPAGRYTVSILVAGYDRWNSDPKIQIRGGETTTEEVTLKQPPHVPCDPNVSKECGGTVSSKTGRGCAGCMSSRGDWATLLLVLLVVSRIRRRSS
jgi:hypothetical protein